MATSELEMYSVFSRRGMSKPTWKIRVIPVDRRGSVSGWEPHGFTGPS